jgi:hypothetical protein
MSTDSASVLAHAYCTIVFITLVVPFVDSALASTVTPGECRFYARMHYSQTNLYAYHFCAACCCVLYGLDEGYGLINNGTFTSPNYPTPYENNIDCLLYTFTGGTNQIVEVQFNYFQLEPRQNDVYVYYSMPFFF